MLDSMTSWLHKANGIKRNRALGTAKDGDPFQPTLCSMAHYVEVKLPGDSGHERQHAAVSMESQELFK